jgi:AAA ATPase-like protein
MFARPAQGVRGARPTVGARAGGALVVRGEPGVGKSALLEYVVERASGFRVVLATGVQSEMELAFAGLHQLCAPMLDRLERLPGPQREALGTAFGLSAGDAPDRFLVALAVLGLLAEVADERPLLCVVDDAQWLDRASAQALGFVARRLLAESVALVFAARESDKEREWNGLPELVVKGLSEADGRALLASVITGPLDERVRDQIVAETRGNPLALLELPRGLTAAELAGGFGLPSSLPLSGQIEGSFRRRLEGLPDGTRRLLLIAAAEPVGEPLLVWRVAERLGIGVEAAPAAADAGLAELGAGRAAHDVWDAESWQVLATEFPGRSRWLGRCERRALPSHLLDGLVAGAGAERGDVRAVVQELPQPLGAVAGERVLDGHRSLQALDVFGVVRSLDSFPAWWSFGEHGHFS